MRATKVFSKEFYFTVYINWDVNDYYKKHVQSGFDKKHQKFPNPEFGCFSKPLTVVDSKGHIILWYLPGLLSEEVEVSFSFFLFFFSMVMDSMAHVKWDGV
jgi:hypothetical protein